METLSGTLMDPNKMAGQGHGEHPRLSKSISLGEYVTTFQAEMQSWIVFS